MRKKISPRFNPCVKKLTQQFRVLVLFVTTLSLLSVLSVNAQNAGVKVFGKVVDSLSSPLQGVTVQEKGKQNSTTTASDGTFSLTVSSNASILLFTSIGYLSKELSAGNVSENISLSASVGGLGEVVIVGYGAQRRRDITSAVASVKSQDFIKGNTRDAGQLLQGRVAGLTVSTPSGDPVQGAQILLRGTNSIVANNAPLVIIDGIPGDLKTVAPEDIDQIDVLKDGSAAAIYGTRASGGVILVTTKRPTGQGTRIDFQSYVSTDRIARKLDLLSADQFRQKISEGLLDASADYGGNTDWLKQSTRKTFTHVHNLTVKAGSAQTHFIANLNYRQFEGVFINSDNKAIIGRLEVNHSMLNGKLKFNAGINGNNTKYTTTADGISFNGFAYRNTIIANPTMPLFIEGNPHYWAQMTDFGSSFFLFENPVGRLNEGKGENSSQKNRYYGNITYTPVKQWRFNTLVSVERFNEVRGYAESFRHVSALSNQRKGFASRGTTQIIDRLLEITGEYNKAFGNSNLSVLGGYGYQDNVFEDYFMQNWNFPTDQFSWNNMGLGQALADGLAPMGSTKSSSNLISFFGRLNYSLSQKYLLAASLRYEGSSRFLGSDKQWGMFPGISFGWRISKEHFLTNSKVISDLKLRLGYGLTGTQPNLLYQSLYRLRYTSNANTFYSNGQYLNLLEPANNRNPEFTWEKKAEYNLGLDFALYGGRINGSIDGYIRKTTDLLFNYQVPIPPNTFTTTLANVGEMENKGLEVLVNFIPVKKKDFDWQSTVTYSKNTNTLTKLYNDKFQSTTDWFYPDDRATGEPIQAPTHRVKVGEPIGQIWGWKVADITNDGKWVYEDKDGNKISQSQAGDSDRKLLGNGLPKFYVAFNNSIRFKSFDLGVTMRGAFKYQIVNFSRMFYENPRDRLLNKLVSAYDKVLNKAVLNDDRAFNSYYVENGDFWKIDNITLGYNLPISKLGKLKQLRVYVASLNTFIMSGYKGIDPEVDRGGLQPGNDQRDKYPSTRSFTFGVNISL